MKVTRGFACVAALAVTVALLCLPVASENEPRAWAPFRAAVGRYDGPRHGSDVPAGLAVDDDGNVYVAGTSFSGDVDADDFYEEVVTLAYGPAGNLLWEAHREGFDASAIAADPAGNVYVAGSARRASRPWDEDFFPTPYPLHPGGARWTSGFGSWNGGWQPRSGRSTRSRSGASGGPPAGNA